MCCFFFTDTAPTEIYTLSLHDALPISARVDVDRDQRLGRVDHQVAAALELHHRVVHRRKLVLGAVALEQRRSEEHTSELQSQSNLVCRLLLEKKKKKIKTVTGEQMSRT